MFTMIPWASFSRRTHSLPRPYPKQYACSSALPVDSSHKNRIHLYLAVVMSTWPNETSPSPWDGAALPLDPATTTTSSSRASWRTRGAQTLSDWSSGGGATTVVVRGRRRSTMPRSCCCCWLRRPRETRRMAGKWVGTRTRTRKIRVWCGVGGIVRRFDRVNRKLTRCKEIQSRSDTRLKMVETKTKALVTKAQGEAPVLDEVELPQLGDQDVTIKVMNCGICHTDLSMANNEWYMTTYPFVGGHEIVGKVHEIGPHVDALKVGDIVGVGWFSSSCLHCDQCVKGETNLCPTSGKTIVGRHGGFANLVRCHQSATVKIPDNIDLASAGPMFCAGLTVYDPISKHIKPTDCVLVIGIGGLGHIALQILNKWGCEVVASTSSPSKAELAKKLGAHEVIQFSDDSDFQKQASRFNFIMVCTSGVDMDWGKYISTLAPKGRIHFLGATPPFPLTIFPMLLNENSVSSSPTGSMAMIREMLKFCGRHGIKPMIEEFKLSELAKAYEHLEAGNARFRIVLKNDL